MNNTDKELLLRFGYRPGELPPEEERELLSDLRSQVADDEEGDRLRNDISADERDGTQ